MEGWKYKGTLVRVIDGDTVVVRLERTFDFGFHVTTRFAAEQTLRIRGINAPEVVGESRERGLETKNAVLKLLSSAVEPLDVVTYKGDKYGRWLADIRVALPASGSVDLAEYLLERELAVPYTP